MTDKSKYSAPNTDDGGVRELLAAGTALGGIENQSFDDQFGATHFLVPSGYQVHALKPLRTRNDGTVARPTIVDPESFIAYLNKYKKDDSTVFASLDSNKVSCVIDYHKADGFDYCDHVVTFPVPFSEQYSRWRGADGKAMTQTAFARFLEENRRDIFEPAAADVLELASDLSIKRSVNFQSAQREQSGEVNFAYKVEDDAGSKKGGNIKVPESFTIKVPIFYNTMPINLQLLLRYRMEEGKLTFFYVIDNRVLEEQTEFKNLVGDIEEQTKLLTIYGQTG